MAVRLKLNYLHTLGIINRKISNRDITMSYNVWGVERTLLSPCRSGPSLVVPVLHGTLSHGTIWTSSKPISEQEEECQPGRKRRTCLLHVTQGHQTTSGLARVPSMHRSLEMNLALMSTGRGMMYAVISTGGKRQRFGKETTTQYYYFNV